MELVYKNEKPLFTLMLAWSLLAWLVVVLITFGLALLYAPFVFLGYCFAQSALISYIKGTGVRITETQFPDLHRKIVDTSATLGLDPVPAAYLMQMGGAFNAFATRFLGRDFLVLYSDVVDALDENPDALNFYIGHEIGHIKRKHLLWAPILLPAAVLPLVGAAYSRAREYTCDRHGLAACASADSAQVGLAVLAAGGKRWRTMNHLHFAEQGRDSPGFWMSFHELMANYPWLVKRMGAVKALAAGREPEHTSRHSLAYILAFFAPRVAGGGAASGMIVMVVMLAILAAVAIPGYRNYAEKSRMAAALAIGQRITAAIDKHYLAEADFPASLEEAGVDASSEKPGDPVVYMAPDGDVHIVIRPDTLLSQKVALVFTPAQGEDGKLAWTCASVGAEPAVVPAQCR